MFCPKPIFLTSEDALNDYFDDSYDDPDVMLYARELTVQLHDPWTLESLHRALAIPTFITDLTFFLPPEAPLAVLEGLHFPRLELFKTNLPHHYLLDFLPAHCSLTVLCLEACGRTPNEVCALGDLDLCHVTTIECPIGCVHDVTHHKLQRLTAQVQQLAGIESSSAVLKSLAAPLTSLFSLTLDIFPDNYDILRSVLACAPHVAALKLLEHPRTSLAKPQGRRAWSNAKSWASQLAKLENLSELALRTSVTITQSRSRLLRYEEATFSKWVLRDSSAPPRYQPRLTSLRVWYRCHDANGGILTYWLRSTGTWTNIARVIGPEAATPF